MGKKKTEEAAAPAPVVKAEEEEEDTPVVKALKSIDEKYCAIETEFEQEMEALRKKYRDERQAPLLAERAKVLGDASANAEDAKFGTPACKGFWLQAFQNADAFAEILEEWDEPVLQYLDDIKRFDVDQKLPQKGFKLDFIFKENPFFTNATISLEIHTDYDPASYKPWKEVECIEVKATEIDWKPGQNITVETIQKKTKGGGAKKAKQKAKSKEEPRDSFFRHFFRTLKVGDAPPPELAAMFAQQGDVDDEDEETQEQMVKVALERCHEAGHCVAEEIIAYAVRFYTGEAGDLDDDDDEESEEEDEDDDDDDDDDSDDEPPPTKGKKGKAQTKAAGGGEAGAKQEECKQQ